MRLSQKLVWHNVFCFNPRTHMGCDIRGVNTYCRLYGFNPRTHMGCDTFWVRISSFIDSFNPRTHMGCDQSPTCAPSAQCSFNPRTHMGCDNRMMKIFEPSDTFQSTHPYGVRLHLFSSCGLPLCFNPRTHMGCDCVLLRKVTLCAVSIHAPIWGATC